MTAKQVEANAGEAYAAATTLPLFDATTKPNSKQSEENFFIGLFSRKCVQVAMLISIALARVARDDCDAPIGISNAPKNRVILRGFSYKRIKTTVTSFVGTASA